MGSSLPFLRASYRFLFTFLLLVAAFLSAGVANGSDLVRDLAAGRPRKVVVYGTSITAGGGWVTQMQDWLTSTYTGPLTLINSGLSGKSSYEGVNQLSAKVLAYHPDTVFIEFAMNDAFLYSDGTPQLTVQQARANLITIVNGILAQNPKAEIILQTTNPAWDSPNGSNQSATLRPNLAAYYQMYRDVAAERGFLLIDNNPNWVALQTTNPATFQAYVPDGTHPSAAAYQAIVTPVLKKRLVGDFTYFSTNAPSPSLLETDVCVYGGTSAAVAAAVQAARHGKRVVMLSPDQWLGGLTTNGLGWTDIGDPTAIGGIAREFYQRIYNYYLSDSVWVGETRNSYLSRSSIDPDTARKVMFTFEPKVARRIYEDMIAESGVTVVRGRLKRSAGGVKKDGAHIREIMTDDGQRSIRAAVFIDATYEGDLMAAAGVSYAVGREANSTYGESLNGIQVARATGNQLPAGIDPYVVPGQPASGLLPGVNATSGGADGTADARLQAYTYRLCLTDLASNRVPVPKPADYQESDFEILFRAIAAGQTGNFFKTSPMPNRKTDSNNASGISTDFIGGNYSLTEGWNWAEASYAKRDEIAAAHVRYEQGFVWALQNSPRVPASVRSAWSSWGLPLDEFTESGGWPGQLYVREARRMLSDFVVTQKHVDQQAGFIAADPVGMGGYQMDSHHAQRIVSGGVVKNEGDIQVEPARGPYGISYKSMVPKMSEADNLLVPVCVSASHIAYGSIRMEPVFMILGQSAGSAAARAINDNVKVQQVDYAALRDDLIAGGQILSTTTTVSGGVIVDNSDASAVTLTGDWTASSASPGFYGADYLHDGNTGRGTKSAKYTPNLSSAGTYEVFARWTTNANRATNARYDIIHAAGTTTVTKNQQQNNGFWVSLGSYQFAAGTAGAVVIRNDNADGYVIADAVRFVSAAAGLPAVHVSATVAKTSEVGSLPGVITLLRDAPGNVDLNVPLTVSGTASAGTDYLALPAVVTIPAGSISTSIPIQALSDSTVEGTETVIVSIAADPAYRIDPPSSATVTISDPPLDRWKFANFSSSELSRPEVSGDLADADVDGSVNLLEYAVGSDPRHVNGASATPAVKWESVGNENRLALYYSKSGSDLVFEVQQSPSLTPAAWTHNGISSELYDAASGLFYQYATVAPGEPARFLRLRVVKP